MLDPGAVYYNLCTEKRDGFLVVDAQSGERILPAEERVEIEATARIEAERCAEALEAELTRLREELAQDG